MVVMLSAFGVFMFALASGVDESLPWHGAEEIAVEFGGSQQSLQEVFDTLDVSGDGKIYYAENLESSDGTSDVENDLDMNNNNILNINNLYGYGGSDIVFRDRPQSRDGLYIRNGISYFNDRIRVDDIQRRTSSGIRFLNQINMNNNRISNVRSPSADSDAATKGYVDNNVEPNYYIRSYSNTGGSVLTRNLGSTSDRFCFLYAVDQSSRSSRFMCGLVQSSGQWQLRFRRVDRCAAICLRW